MNHPKHAPDAGTGEVRPLSETDRKTLIALECSWAAALNEASGKSEYVRIFLAGRVAGAASVAAWLVPGRAPEIHARADAIAERIDSMGVGHE